MKTDLAAVLADLLERVAEDSQAGVVRERDEYLGMYPGFEKAVGKELDSLSAEAVGNDDQDGDTSPSRMIGPYRVIRELGRGGQGAVLLAEDPRLGREVALKVLSLAAFPGEQALERFRREAHVASRLEHPGICAVHEAGLEQDVAWIAMQVVEGQTLAEHIAEARESGSEGPVTLPCDPDEAPKSGGAWSEVVRAVHLVERLARTLHLAHEAGVVHRDIKPKNVMVTPRGEPVLLDFGMAVAEEDVTLTRSGDVFGTPSSMAPEQVLGRRDEVDRRTDVWALGVTLYEALTLRAPFEDETREGLRRNILDSDPPDPRRRISAVPRDLVAVLEKALEKNPARRYATALELAEDLQRVQRHLPVRARRVGVPTRLARWTQRNRAATAAIVVLVIGLISSLVLKAQSDAKTAAVFRLKAQQDLAELLDDVNALWPPFPDRIEDYRAWIRRAEDLVAQLPELRAKRDELRALALPQTEDERRLDRELHPEYPRLNKLERELSDKRRVLQQRRNPVVVPLPPLDGWNVHPDALFVMLDQSPQTLIDQGVETLQVARMAQRLIQEDKVMEARVINALSSSVLALGRRDLRRGMIHARHALALDLDDQVLEANGFSYSTRGFLQLGLYEEALEAMAMAVEVSPSKHEDVYKVILEDVQSIVDSAKGEAGQQMAGDEVSGLEEELAALEERVGRRRSWRFSADHEDERWWALQLTDLIKDLEDLQSGLLAADAATPGYGMSVPRRLEIASRLKAGFSEGGEYYRAWHDALPSIRTTYPGLDMKPQMGLTPIGQDPDSRLWEFAHLLTGEAAERGPGGELILTDQTGVVLVLMKRGMFWRGAQSADPKGRNYFEPMLDPEGKLRPARYHEEPVKEVGVSELLVSKYELTQGQWIRLTGDNPSFYGPRNFGAVWLESMTGWSPRQPLENVRKEDLVEWLARVDLMLPSGTQWEYAARGGTESPWWTGWEKESLQGAANLLDRWSEEHHGVWYGYERWLQDGATAHAPIGSYAPNPFGLHDVIGNVGEFCADVYDPSFNGLSEGWDPMGRLDNGGAVIRGGTFRYQAWQSRSSSIKVFPRGLSDKAYGARPSRAIDR